MMTAKQSAARLLNGDVTSIGPIGSGRNSQVYRLIGPDSQAYALKIYFRHTSDKRDRLKTEFFSLNFLWKNGVRSIPQPLTADYEEGCALYEYIDGQQIAMDSITNEEIDGAIQFLANLKNLKGRDGSSSFSSASEACFSVQAIVKSIQERLKCLSYRGMQEKPYPDLYDFLDGQFVPKLEEIVHWCQANLRKTRISFESDIDQSERTLSPSDFGLHNALKRSNGQIIFLDFEYFGWDDPAKMIIDMLLHPGMQLCHKHKKLFARSMIDCFADCPNLTERIKIVYPLFGSKWCLILLNEFLPDQLRRRQFAGVGGNDSFALQMEQLLKAQSMLQMIDREYKNLPYLN